MWRRIRLDRVPVPTLGAAPPAARVLRRVPHFALQPTRWNILHWCSWAAALAIELWLVAELQGGQIFGWEQSVTRSLQDVPGKGLVFDVTSTLTNTLSAPFLLIFATIAAFMMVGGHRWATSVLLLSFPLHVLAQFPKALVDRPRPS